MSKAAILEAVLFIGGGVLSGVVLALFIDTVLFEITFNGFFAVAFGIALLLLAAVIIFRLYSQADEIVSNALRIVLFSFALLVLITGFFCFFLERNWYHGLSAQGKVPMYFLLGLSLAFSMLYSVTDLVRYGILRWGFLSDSNDATSLAASPILLYTIVCSALVLGSVFGLTFGLVDVEAVGEARLGRLSSINLALGALIGAALGSAHFYLQNRTQSSFRF